MKKQPKSYQDLDYNEVVNYADKRGLNTDSLENFREAAIAMFNEKYAQKPSVDAKKKPGAVVIVLPTKPGYSATIETDTGIFNLRNTYDTDTNFSSIDIYNEGGKFLDEFVSGFGVSDDRQDEDNMANLTRVAEYINENIIL